MKDLLRMRGPAILVALLFSTNAFAQSGVSSTKKASKAKGTTPPASAPASTPAAGTGSASAAATNAAPASGSGSTPAPATDAPSTTTVSASTSSEPTSSSSSGGPAANAFTLEKLTLTGGPSYGSNDLNLGVALRFGYTLRQGIYLGGAADYWFGTSQDQNFGGATIKSSAHGWDVLGDVGYDFAPTTTVVLRPFAGFGIFGASVEACTSGLGAPVTTCVKSSDSKGVGSFGGQALVDVGGLNLGGELRLLFYNGDTAAIIGGRIGLTF
jgi:hypothetical protein